MLNLSSNILLVLVSSQAIMSTSFKVSMVLIVISCKFPMGVGHKYMIFLPPKSECIFKSYLILFYHKLDFISVILIINYKLD